MKQGRRRAGGLLGKKHQRLPSPNRAPDSLDEARKRPSPSDWGRAVGATAVAVTAVVVVVLVAVDAGEGPVVWLLGLLGGGAVFAISLSKVFEPFSGRQRVVFAVGMSVLAAVLVAAGLVTRTVAPLPELTGAQDVAIVGFVASDESVQTQFDAAAASLAEILRSPVGDVADYSGLVSPPLDEFAGAKTDALDIWAESFVARTGRRTGSRGLCLGAGQSANATSRSVSTSHPSWPLKPPR